MNDTEHPEPPANETGDRPESAKSGPTSRFFALVDDAEARRLPRGLLVLCFSLVVMVLLVVIFQQLGEILRPLFIAAFIGYLIMPVHSFLVRMHLPPVSSYVLIVLVVVTLLFGFGRVVYTSVDAMKEKMPTYEKRVEAYVEIANNWIDGLHRLLNKLKPESARDREAGTTTGSRTAGAAETPAVPGPANSGERFSRDYLREQIMSTLKGAGNFLFGMLVVIVYLAFLLAESETVERRVRHVFGAGKGSDVLDVIEAINLAISKYIAVKTSVNLLTGVLTVAVLLPFGVDFAFLWGVIAFLFNYIPYLGSVVGAGLPIALAFLQFEFGWRFAAVAILLLGVQNVIGYIVEPRITGRQLDLSPLMVLLALAFWGWLWGTIGMILAVPIVVSLKIIFDHIPATKPIAGLMSAAPAADE